MDKEKEEKKSEKYLFVLPPTTTNRMLPKIAKDIITEIVTVSGNAVMTEHVIRLFVLSLKRRAEEMKEQDPSLCVPDISYYSVGPGGGYLKVDGWSCVCHEVKNFFCWKIK